MTWQWIVLAISAIAVSSLAGLLINKEHMRRTGEELDNATEGEVIALALILIWIGVIVGRCSISW